MTELVATYSIAACDLDARQWGVATQSKFPAVGSVVPWAEPQIGAIATQAYANPRYGPEGLALLREGLPAAEVVARLTASDPGRDERQLGVVDGEGGSSAYTGAACHGWAGSPTGLASRISRSGSTATTRSIPSSSSGCGRSRERALRGQACPRPAGDPRRGCGDRLAPDPAHVRHPRVWRQRLQRRRRPDG